jgi:hypothetical protein
MSSGEDGGKMGGGLFARFPAHGLRDLGLALLAAVVLFGVIQLVPFGHDHSNPAVQAEPLWDTPQTRALAVRACFACHSNQTTWPWYSSVAPLSWLIQRDVNAGRARLNFSEWTTPQPAARRAGQAVQTGNMPPWFYLPLHGTAKLSAAERQQLIQGLEATIARNPPGLATAR